MDDIKIGIDSWIIQDGNYDDFKTGEQYQFALEFYPVNFSRAQNKIKKCIWEKGSTYKINGEVIYIEKDVWALDFGLKAYEESPALNGIKINDWIEAEIYIGIDPFFYFEDFSKIKNFPSLSYRWEITKIELETTPLLEVKPKTFERDKNNESYKEITKTDAWNDFEGLAHYIFHCKIV